MNEHKMNRINKRINEYFRNDRPLSRKAKLAFIGRKLNKSKLRGLLSTVKIIAGRCDSETIVYPFVFCPECGCTATESTGNMVAYPEIWQRHRCVRCGFLVAEADNSRTMFALENPQNNYELD